jgi:hypothetical protein
MLEIGVESEALQMGIQRHMKRLEDAEARRPASFDGPTQVLLFAKDCQIEMLTQQHMAVVRILESSTRWISRRPREWRWSSGCAKFGRPAKWGGDAFRRR